eukprot:11199462-Alexandrium_andersonii.AAC.1
MPAQHVRAFARRGAPEPGGPVPGAGEELEAGWRESRAPDCSLVAAQYVLAVAGGGAPEPCRPVGAAGEDL